MGHLRSRTSIRLPELHHLAGELTALAAQLVRTLEYPADDNFCFMALAFLHKQIGHLKSMRSLSGSSDIGLIARSMLEGHWQLRWAARDRDRRAEQWRRYDHVHAWRAMRADLDLGRPVEEEHRRAIERQVEESGQLFLTRSARKARRAGHPLPRDPYWHNWTGHDIRQLAEAVSRAGGQESQHPYLTFYRPFSEWRHWSSALTGACATATDDGVRFVAADPPDTEDALAIGFRCLADALILTLQYVRRPVPADLGRVMEAFSAWEKTGSDAVEVARG